MPSSDDRFYGEDVSFADMAEAPRRERESKAKNIAVVVATTVVVLLLAVVLIRGSLPAMTPEQIVQREDYEGQQPPRHIFNLYSLKQDKLNREHKSRPQDQILLADTDAIPVIADQKDEPAITDSTPQAVVSAAAPVKAEVPAVVKLYEKSELSRESVLPVVSAVTSSNIKPAIDANNAGSRNRVVTVLPVYTIKADQTNLRSQPFADAPVIKTLNKGQTITVFDDSGKWVQVATNDGQGTTGYVHHSLLEIADIDR